MSEVWLADDAQLGRQVVVKFLGAGADAARFEREARAAAALGHPNICQVYDYGTADARPFMVLEYLPGGTLEGLLKPGRPLPDDQSGRILTELAEGLAHAHQRGLVHRDLKPANVLFDAEGRAKIADFGIARLGEASTLTEAGTVLGTAAYISPEQAAGDPVTPASDVYSFGVIAYRMLTGRPPFESEQPLELARMHMEDMPPPIQSLRPDAPPVLAQVATAAMAKIPAARPPDGVALLAQLQPGQAPTLVTVPLAVAAGETAVIVPPARFVAPRRLAMAGLVAALLAAGIAAAILLTGSPTTHPARVKNPTTHDRNTTSAATTSSSSTTQSTSTNTSMRTSTTTPSTAPPSTTTRASTSTTAPTLPTTSSASITTTAPTTTAPTTTGP
jgi:serine/threonine-protein kinase